MSCPHEHSVLGFTLIEALLASVVLAASVTAITVPFSSAAQNQHVEARRTQAVALAQELMEEILAQSFADDNPDTARNPGPEMGETDRRLFDNVDDYVNLGNDPSLNPTGAITVAAWIRTNALGGTMDEGRRAGCGRAR